MGKQGSLLGEAAAFGRTHAGALLAIGATVAALALAFAYTAGWFPGHRIAPGRVADALEAHDGLHPGFRRAHAKGMCFSGHLDGNGNGLALSRATVFAPGTATVVGRFSTGGGMPDSPDGRLVFRALAMSVTASDGAVWRTGMDSTPIFPVATPAAFVDFLQATMPAADGKPDGAKVAAYMSAHPETVAFTTWLKNNPLPSSFANSTFNSINAFRFTNAAGEQHFVRWTLLPAAPLDTLDKATLAALPPDFLFDDLQSRAAKGPLHWRLHLTVAQPGDATDNATVAWPADRPQVDAGELTIDKVASEEAGGCRDLNFDPLVLPPGIAPSDDPLLPARSAVYASSFRRRAAEGAHPGFDANATQASHHE
jgi:catalase